MNPATLEDRVPTATRDGLGGFDAGIACCLDLIPRGRQRLAACHHAAYTPSSVQQARREIADLDADSETCWWLAACSVCDEGPVAAARFLDQLDEFETLASDPDRRLAAATAELDAMLGSFHVVDGVAYADRDGGAQGAYLSGHDIAVTWSSGYGIWFIGTFRPTLGLDEFEWEDLGQPGSPGKSGPVGGSSQFVKAASRAELDRVLAASRLGH